MSKQTLQQQHVAALLKRGFVELKDASSRYTVLHLQRREVLSGKLVDLYAWVGASGAVRMNTLKRVDTSRSMSEAWKQKLREELAQHS